MGSCAQEMGLEAEGKRKPIEWENNTHKAPINIKKSSGKTNWRNSFLQGEHTCHPVLLPSHSAKTPPRRDYKVALRKG